MDKEVTFKPVGMARYSRAVYLDALIVENMRVVFWDDKGEKPTETQYNTAYSELKRLWKEFVEFVLVDATGVTDIDEIGFDVMKQVREGFTKAAAGLIAKSNAA